MTLAPYMVFWKWSKQFVTYHFHFFLQLFIISNWLQHGIHLQDLSLDCALRSCRLEPLLFCHLSAFEGFPQVVQNQKHQGGRSCNYFLQPGHAAEASVLCKSSPWTTSWPMGHSDPLWFYRRPLSFPKRFHRRFLNCAKVCESLLFRFSTTATSIYKPRSSPLPMTHGSTCCPAGSYHGGRPAV